MVVWLKRLLPIFLIAIIVSGWVYYDWRRKCDEADTIRRHARATAHIWFGSAINRDDTVAFLDYRDSILAAESLTVDEVQSFLEIYRDRPERYEAFTRLIRLHVDSLVSDRQGPPADSM